MRSWIEKQLNWWPAESRRAHGSVCCSRHSHFFETCLILLRIILIVLYERKFVLARFIVTSVTTSNHGHWEHISNLWFDCRSLLYAPQLSDPGSHQLFHDQQTQRKVSIIPNKAIHSNYPMSADLHTIPTRNTSHANHRNLPITRNKCGWRHT